MKIGIDVSQIVYQTGVSRYTVELVKHLLELDTKNQFFLYAGSLRQRPLLTAFIKGLNSKKLTSKLTYLSPKLLELFWNRLNILRPDKNQNLDVFHASNWALPKTKCPVVTTIHDLTFLKYPNSHLPYYIKAHTRHLNRANKYADHIITDSESSKKDLVDYGINQDKISVIYPAPAKLFKPVANPKLIKQTLNKYSLSKPFILSVGTQEPRKNLKRLIKAYKLLKPNHKKLSLAIAGKFGWGDRTKPVKGVKLLGFVPDEDLQILYSSAKVFVYPSLYEGFGFPILEAFKCGCPVITSNLSSMPELGGDAAFYCNPKKVSEITNTINLVLSLSPQRKDRITKRGLDHAKLFTSKATAQQTLKVYQKAASC